MGPLHRKHFYTDSDWGELYIVHRTHLLSARAQQAASKWTKSYVTVFSTMVSRYPTPSHPVSHPDSLHYSAPQTPMDFRIVILVLLSYLNPLRCGCIKEGWCRASRRSCARDVGEELHQEELCGGNLLVNWHLYIGTGGNNRVLIHGVWIFTYGLAHTSLEAHKSSSIPEEGVE